MEPDVIEKIKGHATSHHNKTGWKGCQAVNPNCPSDLCVRPYKHTGPHQLGTSGGEPDVRTMVMAPETVQGPREERDLIDFGWWLGHFIYDCHYKIDGLF